MMENDSTRISNLVRDFERRHGAGKGEPDKGWIIYPDGAKREAFLSGLISEPSENDWQRYDAQAHYYEKRAKRLARDAFNLANDEYNAVRDYKLRQMSAEEQKALIDDLREEATFCREFAVKFRNLQARAERMPNIHRGRSEFLSTAEINRRREAATQPATEQAAPESNGKPVDGNGEAQPAAAAMPEPKAKPKAKPKTAKKRPVKK